MKGTGASAVALLVAISAGCGSSAASSDAAVAVPDVMAAPDSSPAPDVATVDAEDAGMPALDVPREGPPPGFQAIAPCASHGDYASGPRLVATGAMAYEPRCLRVPAGVAVTFEASVLHPLEPRTGGTSPNPIPHQTQPASVTFVVPGFYPFVCPEHVDQGMLGVIWVEAQSQAR